MPWQPPPQIPIGAEVSSAEPDRLSVTRIARDTATMVARLRGLRRRRAIGELNDEAYRREAALLESDAAVPRDPR